MKHLKLPSYKQTHGYDCGAKTTQSVLSYYGIEMKEEKIMIGVKTNKTGTPTCGIISFLKKKGLRCIDKENLTINDLKKQIDKGNPVIVLLQAYSNKPIKDWKKSWNSGHYVIAIGYDKEKVIFEDPMSSNRTYLDYKELEKRWHDLVQDRGKIRNFGLIIKGKKHYNNIGKIIPMR
ncbi:MAG: C39 family peptidase [archaeon]|nr:C39 family peptidase [archaeon]MCR4323553.1 C39 family peptidase [Nanoarchaeota archaeon]